MIEGNEKKQETGFLHQKYPKLHQSFVVKSAQRAVNGEPGQTLSHQPTEKIGNYLTRLESFFTNPNETKRERGIGIIKRMMYDRYVIKPSNVQENYFKSQQRILREQGYGYIEISNEMRQQETEIIVKDQKQSLDIWIDYLSSPEAMYPTWLKYYIIRNIVKLGPYDKEKKEFSKRSRTTTTLFPDLNHEALAYVLDSLEKLHTKGEKTGSSEWQSILDQSNFAQLYAHAIEKVTPVSQEQRKATTGHWVKYDQGSDATPLYQSLQGYGTGWCTAGENVARQQLSTSDFYVYYSTDQHKQNTIPRVAIRMQENEIAEVRGINPDQNLEAAVSDITNEKMETLPGAEKYRKKSADMKRLTAIEANANNGKSLSIDELRFLYEIDGNIDGFGYQKDPRIQEILSGRNLKSDISFITGFPQNQISTNKTEALKGDIKYHYGDINLYDLTSAVGLKLPESINGNLDLGGLTSAVGLKLPESINGSLGLYSLTSAVGLKLPESINGSLNLYSLTSAVGLKLPESINGNLDLGGLTSAVGLKLPELINGNLNLYSLTSAVGLKLPELINGNLNLYNLTSAVGLKLPELINGSLYLGGLTSAEKEKLKIQYPNLKDRIF